MSLNKNKLIKIKLRKIQYILNNQLSGLCKSGFAALKNAFYRDLIKQELQTNKNFQKELISTFVRRINQVLKPTNIIIKKRFFNLMRIMQKTEESMRILRYEALKILIFNNKLLLRRAFSAFQEKG